MELSRLEIKGFKSFGDKVVLNFDKGITGVVGPNGCGKSNIVDAIRWVLGEQKTRVLRSDKMTNIIFNGTKKRKPLQMAEVSLTFNNTKNIIPTEYSQVHITRRYYRSGESEYLLNGVQCRLKDITELFMDTGIGSDSYAIIELKMVDDILNDNNNARRTLFEEASGISKFKTRKKQTLKKLEDTDKDLNRVEDILYEIDKNLKSLEKQAKQAEKYHVLKAEYKELSIQMAHFNMSDYQEKFILLKKQVESNSLNRTEVSKIVITKETELEKIKKDLIKKENLLSSRQKTLNEQFNKIRQYEADKKIRGERLKHLNDKTDSLNGLIKGDKLSLETNETELKILKEELISAEKNLKDTEKNVSLLEKSYEAEKKVLHSFREQLSEEGNVLNGIQNEVFQLKKSLEISEVQVTKLSQDLHQSFTDNSNNEIRVGRLKEERLVLAKDMQSLEHLLHNLRDKEDKNKVAIEKSESNIDKVKTTLFETNRTLDATENEYKLTKSLVDNLEGFPDAIKFLKKNTNWNNDAPLLSDLITCDSKYRLAIENHLEHLMNHYVVDDISEAHHAIKLLSESSKGKAQFFVLNNIEAQYGDGIATPQNTIPAISIVEYDSKYTKIVELLLHNTFISTSANYNIPEDNRYTFLSLDGKITKRKHSISGGAVGLFEGKRIGRAKNLEKLNIRIKGLQKNQQKIQHELDKETNILLDLKEKAYRKQIDKKQTALNKLNTAYTSVITKIEQIENVLANTQDKTEIVEQSIKILREAIAKSTPQLKEKELTLKIAQETNEKTVQAIKKLNDQVSEKSQGYNTENILFHQGKNKVFSIEKDISYKTTQYKTLSERIFQNTQAYEQVAEGIKKMLASTDFSDEDLLALYDEKEQIEIGVTEAEKDYYASRGTITELENEIREINRNRENIDNILLESQEKLNEVKLKINSVRERLSVEFNINVDQLKIDEQEHDDSGKSIEDLLDEVEKVKKSIDRLGTINPMAVEAYEEIKERHVFITEQRDDLLSAKKSLHNTISEIDQVAKENFTQAFTQIQTNFQEVFRSLFTEEDTCSLTLVNPEEPLDSAIEITAKPKGKRPLTINQLSGGEKTLTAVALLFAIYLIKPAPFCIFDEVDAPLDDANIDKFNKIIRKFSTDSQFIIVTHNKRTMSTTDVIYGVTMQELGVSKLIPVDLRSLPDAVL